MKLLTVEATESGNCLTGSPKAQKNFNLFISWYMENQTKQFFESMVGEYNHAIELCVPRYDEMLWAIMYYLPSCWKPVNILELGCGSGNLSELVAQTFPHAKLCLIDQSEKFLSSCSSRLRKYKSIQYLQWVIFVRWTLNPRLLTSWSRVLLFTTLLIKKS